MSAYRGWAVVEFLGHRRLVGLVSETSFAGTTLLRIDVPVGRDLQPTRPPQFYRAEKAIYSITGISEEEALREIAPPADPPDPDRVTEEERLITQLETEVRKLLEDVMNAAAAEKAGAAYLSVRPLRATIAALDKSRAEDAAMAAELAAEGEQASAP